MTIDSERPVLSRAEGSRTIKETVQRGLPLTDVLVIDAHAHLGPYFALYAAQPDADHMVALMDRLGIDQTIISPDVAIGPDFRLGNDQAAEAAREHPGRLLPYCTIDPHGENLEAELERCFDQLGAVGIKIHPSGHSYPADGPNYQPMWEFAHERGTFVLSHTWKGSSDCAPETFGPLADKYPQVSIIFGHAGGGPSGYPEAMEVAEGHPNIFLDTCGSMFTSQWIEKMVERLGSEKIVFGTDHPFFDPRTDFGRVTMAHLSDEDKRNILGLNIGKLLEAQGIKRRE